MHGLTVVPISATASRMKSLLGCMCWTTRWRPTSPHAFGPAVGAEQHQRPQQDRGQRDDRPLGYAEEFEGGTDAGELADDQAGVGQQQAENGERGQAETELHEDQRAEALAGVGAEPDGHLLHHDVTGVFRCGRVRDQQQAASRCEAYGGRVDRGRSGPVRAKCPRGGGEVMMLSGCAVASDTSSGGGCPQRMTLALPSFVTLTSMLLALSPPAEERGVFRLRATSARLECLPAARASGG